MKEEEIVINGIPIKYIFKEKKYDTQHLVVVFSGFGGQTEFTYDFLNALTMIKANVLWIKDDFFGHCSYYLAHKNDFRIEDSVIDLIYKFMHKTSTTKDCVTILGASKGGSAALYYGIKYDFLNIMASVPQLLIGNYITSVWPIIGRHMMGEEGDVVKFNALIEDQIIQDQQTNKNIYLLTSEVDIQYEEHIAPFLKMFYKYSNFNALFSESILVREHNQITGHHVDVITGLISMLSVGIAPRIGLRPLIGEPSIKEEEIPTSLIELQKIYIKSERLYIEGVGIVRGKEADRYDQINYKLTLISDKNISFELGKGHRPQLTRQYYNGNFCIYDKCWFTTYNYKGIDISKLPEGKYKLYLEITFEDYHVIEALNYSGKIQNHDGYIFTIENGELHLEKVINHIVESE